MAMKHNVQVETPQDRQSRYATILQDKSDIANFDASTLGTTKGTQIPVTYVKKKKEITFDGAIGHPDNRTNSKKN